MLVFLTLMYDCYQPVCQVNLLWAGIFEAAVVFFVYTVA